MAAMPCLAATPAPAPVCERRLVAEATLRDDDGFVGMPVRLGGQAASLLVDTGSDGGW